MYTQTKMGDVETGPTQSTVLQESTGVRADPSLYRTHGLEPVSSLVAESLLNMYILLLSKNLQFGQSDL